MLTDLLHTVTTMTPLGLAALQGLIIYLLVRGHQQRRAEISTLASNHLHELPTIAADIRVMRELLQTVNDNVVYLKARSNGRDR